MSSNPQHSQRNPGSDSYPVLGREETGEFSGLAGYQPSSRTVREAFLREWDRSDRAGHLIPSSGLCVCVCPSICHTLTPAPTKRKETAKTESKSQVFAIGSEVWQLHAVKIIFCCFTFWQSEKISSEGEGTYAL